MLVSGAGAGGAIALVPSVAPCLCLFVLATVFWAREVLAPHGRLWIAEDGVGQVGAFRTLVVPWSQIAEIAVTGPALGAKYVSITVRDARRLGRKTARTSALRQSRRPLGLPLRGWLAAMTLLGKGPFGATDVYDAAMLDLPPTRWDISATAFPISSRRWRRCCRSVTASTLPRTPPRPLEVLRRPVSGSTDRGRAHAQTFATTRGLRLCWFRHEAPHSSEPG